MKLTVLGKYGPYPPAGGATSGYLLQSGGTNILLDCGSGILSRLQEHIKLGELSAIVLSHLHSDHIADMLILRYAIQFMRETPLLVFAPTKPVVEYDMLRGSGVFELIAVNDGMRVKAGDIDLEFYEMTHPVQSFGVRACADGKTLAYTGDTNLNERVVDLAKGADLYLADAGFLNSGRTGVAIPHMTALEVGQTAKQADVKRLICSHISPRVNESEVLNEARVAFITAEVAKEGETITI